MSGDRSWSFGDPVAHIIVVLCFGFFCVAVAFVLGIVLLPIAGAAAAAFYGYRYWRLQQLRVRLPESRRGEAATGESQAALKPKYDPDRFAADIHGKVLKYLEADTGRTSCKALSDTFTGVMTQLYEQESFHKPPEQPTAQDIISKANYQDRLEAWLKKTSDSEPYTLFGTTVGNAYLELRDYFPASAFVENPDVCGTVPLEITMDPGQVRELAATFFLDEVVENRLFEGMRERILANDAANDQAKRKMTFETVFAGTPIEEFSSVQVPFAVPLDKQLEHSVIVAGSRYGKSQLIGSIIAAHLKSENPPGIIVIDPTGDFANIISRNALFARGGRLEGQLIVLDPIDSPQLNMFDISAVRAKGYDAKDQEQVEADITNLFNYVFSAIGSDLTSQQGTGFTFLVRLLITMPGSNIKTLLEILDTPAKTYAEVPAHFRKAIEQLDLTSQGYFRNQFFTLNMLATRQGVARRLYGLTQVPAFERMFSGGNRIDFFQAMQDGKIIVVNTGATQLQATASSIFGRYIIARVMSGAFERTVIRDMSKRRPCLLFIDEAQNYFDGAIDTMLTQIGKYKLGLCLAFQYLGQTDDKLLKSILGNTTVKYAGGLAAAEARMIARELRVDEEFILARRKDSSKKPYWAEFATHIKYTTPQAVCLTVPFYSLEDMAQMTDEEHAEFKQANRELVAGNGPPSPPVNAPPQSTPSQAPPPKPARPPSTPQSETTPPSEWE